MTVIATFNGQTIASSDDTVVVEGHHYFPRADVREHVLAPAAGRTLCPWKGLASYADVGAGGVTAPKAAWTYRHPLPFARRIKDRVAFAGTVQVSEP